MFFKTWPGLSSKLITKHLPPVTATAKVHLMQTQQHLQSTKRTPMNETAYLDNIRKNIKALNASATPESLKNPTDLLCALIDVDAFPPSGSPNLKTNEVIYALFDSSPTGLAYINLTGRFPYRSSRGNEYILVGYHYDANAILCTALKNVNQSQSQRHGRNSTKNSSKLESHPPRVLLTTRPPNI